MSFGSKYLRAYRLMMAVQCTQVVYIIFLMSWTKELLEVLMPWAIFSPLKYNQELES